MAQRPESTIEADAIVSEVLIAAPVEAVYEFFVDPSKHEQWKGRAAELDPRPGGKYRVELNDKATAAGKYIELDPPRRVVMSWGWEGEGPVPAGSTTVDITLEATDEGTLVRLVHRDLPEPARADHMDGWNHYLSRLAAAAVGQDPGPDPNETA
jgi:uncharacterized protein YndB with AHSA1/START domain